MRADSREYPPSPQKADSGEYPQSPHNMLFGPVVYGLVVLYELKTQRLNG